MTTQTTTDKIKEISQRYYNEAADGHTKNVVHGLVGRILDLLEWQSIETAPKDGTVVDLIVNGERVPDAYWSFSRNADGSLHETAYDCWAKKGQYAGMGGVYPVGVGGEPTHWMRRPECPKQ